MPPRQRRSKTPDPRRTAFLLDRQASARQAILNGLVRAVGVVLRSLAAGMITPTQAARQTRELVDTARAAAAEVQWSTADAVGEAPVKGNTGLDPWDADDLDEILALDPGDADSELPRLLGPALDDASEEAARQHAEKNPRVTGYRRVVHPERSKGGTCGLCVLAATRVYRTRDLRPIHDGCECTVMEVTGAFDPGDALNGLDLGEIYGDAGGTTPEQAKKVRYRVNPQTGEMERYADPKQRLPENDPNEIRKRRRKRSKGAPEDSAQRIKTLKKTIRDLEERQANGEDVALQLDSARKRLARLQKSAA